MKKIVLTSVVAGYADDYLRDLRALNNKPEDRLVWLKTQMPAGTAYSGYVDTIFVHYKDIIRATPEDMRNHVAGWFAGYAGLDLAQVFTIDVIGADGNLKAVSKKFYQWVVDALGYDDVQEKVFPKYVKRLGIKSCVYCNAQYAVAAKRGKTGRGKVYRANYTIDHYLPKSEYPYLATSFFNLYPACSSCNQMKSYKAPLFELYVKPTDAAILRNPFVFRLDKHSFVKYSMTGRAEDLVLKFETRKGLPAGTVDAAAYEDYFHVEKLYANYCDTVEEVIWKYRMYNKAGRQALVAGFSDVLPHKSDWNRFVLGNYDQERDVLKRPLAKVVQDVAKQLGII